MKFGSLREWLQNFWTRWPKKIEDRYFYIRKGDNNYSISMKIFGYNPKLSLKHWILRCFAAKTTKAATKDVL